MLRKALLAFGILSSLLFAAMNVVAPMRYEGYSVASQTVSELSAIGAPTQAFWIAWGRVYDVLLAGFGAGVWMSAAGRRPLRVAGAAMILQALLGLVWPPMHQRGAETTLTDTMHVVITTAALLCMLVAMLFAAKALGGGFRRYTLATVGVFVVFGVLTSLDGPRIAANQPTPLVGVWERINIAAFLLWGIVLAVLLLREGPLTPGAGLTGPRRVRASGPPST